MTASFQNVTVIGAGVIGASWAALMLASGRDVVVCDAAEGAEERVHAYIAGAWPALLTLGIADPSRRGTLRFEPVVAAAVSDADFVQESVPENLSLKHALYREIETQLKPGTIVATSASGLLLSEMQAGWTDPGRFVLGHPFNPPHLVPLVEVMGNERTATGVLEQVEAFYASIHRITIRVRREVPGHIANRLQAALWQEAIHLVNIGAATVEDIDKAVWAGPGARWAAMGPMSIFHLAVAQGGLGTYCESYRESFHRWWDDLGSVRLDDATVSRLAEGMAQASGHVSREELIDKRDKLLTGILAATKALR